MAKRHASALKQKRQSLKRRKRNRAVLSSLRTMVKKLNASLTDKRLDEGRTLLKKTVSAFDRATTKGIVHHNTAARKISRLMIKANKVLSSDKTA